MLTNCALAVEGAGGTWKYSGAQVLYCEGSLQGQVPEVCAVSAVTVAHNTWHPTVAVSSGIPEGEFPVKSG